MSRADDVARELVGSAAIRRPPVQVEQLARQEGAVVVFQPLDGDVSGMLLRTDGRTVIGVNSAHSKRRQRFTIAHEIGHLLLHEGRKLVVDKTVRVDFRDRSSSLATSREEIEANRFAAALLMPADILQSEVRALMARNRFLDDAMAEELAERFDVSSQAMGYRLMNLGFSLGT